jgi:hypothetical protein
VKENEKYEHLLRKYRQRFPDADKNQLIKRLNSLRTNFRKELKRMKGSEKSGTGADDVVGPTLWYFEEIKFLIGQEESCTSLNIIRIGEEGEQESEEMDNVGDTSATNTVSVRNHFISYSFYYANLCCMKPGLHFLKKIAVTISDSFCTCG